ncbi:GntR family transcriptional regulator [Burkholderia perseverans]|uniref:GntR family transcriptional regulator n=1 Tax=Burkholderia perseverans TaxID=2615214 RepID=UPI001FEE252D|nr:GntR family transcriptional regulator [Burkholderia perseverans]
MGADGLKDESKVGGDSSDSLPARIAAGLAEQIIRGELKPGDRVRQDTVASDFNASHVPVREAFRRLEARGLLVSRERKGVYVPLLDRASIVEIMRMRVVLEGLALKHAIPNVTGHDLDLAEYAIAEAAHCNDIASWEEANRRFHSSLYAPCGMPRLLADIERLHEARLRYMYATAAVIDWHDKSEQEHRGLVDAVRRGDVEAACSILARHIEDAGEILVAAVARVSG